MSLLARSLQLATAIGILAIAGAATQEQASATVAPCDLLDASEVSIALGEVVEAARPMDNGKTPQGASSLTCVWVARADQGDLSDATRPFGGRPFVILNVMRWPGAPTESRKFLESFHTSFREGVIGVRPEPVSIGADEALWWGDGIAARRSRLSFGISVASAGDRSERRPKAEQLAKLIAQRMPAKPV